MIINVLFYINIFFMSFNRRKFLGLASLATGALSLNVRGNNRHEEYQLPISIRKLEP